MHRMRADAGHPSGIAYLDRACRPMSEATIPIIHGTTAVDYG